MNKKIEFRLDFWLGRGWRQQHALREHLQTQIPSWLTQLVGELLTQDGHRGADALENGGGEGGTNGQAVDKVVQAIAQCDHPGQRANVGVRCPLQPIAATTTGAGSPCTVCALGVLAWTRTCLLSQLIVMRLQAQNLKYLISWFLSKLPGAF